MPRRPAEPLAGLTVFVARPVGQARPITARVRRLGGTAVALPTASLRALPSPDPALMHDADLAIFTSPAAVRFAQALPVAGRTAIAVGPSTASALRRRGVDPIVPRRYDSEGVLALPQLAEVAGRTVVIVTAPGGRMLMKTALEERGAEVRIAAVYERRVPRWTARHHAALSTAPRAALIVSSADALAVVTRLSNHRFARDLLVVPGERVELAARGLGYANVVRARSALPADLVAALTEHATRLW